VRFFRERPLLAECGQHGAESAQDSVTVSFDIVLQAFTDGDAAGGDIAALRAVLEPLVRHRDGYGVQIETADGEADVYGLDDDEERVEAVAVMVNHASGRALWDVLYDAARAAGLVVMPVGCPVCVTDERQIPHLPPELVDAAGVVVVRSGADILAAVEAS
jgi:hypothetical protein